MKLQKYYDFRILFHLFVYITYLNKILKFELQDFWRMDFLLFLRNFYTSI